MHRSLVASAALLVLVALGAGCATSRNAARSPRPRSFVLAVTVNRTLQPTPQQWAVIQANFARVLAARGWVLVNDVSLADHILRIDFSPDPEAPENRGRATVLAVRNNPRSTVARRGNGPYSSSAFSYSSGMGSFWPSSSYYSNSYYGYGGFYDDGYSGGSYTPVILTPPPTTPPYRHRPGLRDDCPPDHVPGQFAGHIPDPAHDRPRPPPSDYGRWNGERPVAHANRGYSRSDPGHARSDSHWSPPSSYSPPEPSYTPPSYSDAASSASNSAAVEAAASAAISAPPVEAVQAER